MFSSEKEKILEAVLDTEEYSDFRRKAYHAGRAVIRRRRAPVYPWLAIAAAAAALLLVFVVATRQKPVQTATYAPVATAAPEIDSNSKVVIVETKPIDETMVVRSVPNKALTITTASVSLSKRPTPLSDEELVAMFADQGAGFVGSGENRHFVIARPADDFRIQ